MYIYQLENTVIKPIDVLHAQFHLFTLRTVCIRDLPLYSKFFLNSYSRVDFSRMSFPPQLVLKKATRRIIFSSRGENTHELNNFRACVNKNFHEHFLTNHSDYFRLKIDRLPAVGYFFRVDRSRIDRNILKS